MGNSEDLKSAQDLFSSMRLSFPYIPDVFQANFHLISPFVYSSRPGLPFSPYAIDYYIKEAESKYYIPGYIILGHAGHGVNSYAIHFYLVYKNLALFIQAAWGGVYSDKKKDAVLINKLFSEAEKIIRATEQSLITTDRREIIADSSFYNFPYKRVLELKI